ncbi:hypothetical protein ZYGR_0AZ02090 [Zygosaccharomyces rouxii]|uniref:SAM-dependent MTase RsmB/NOP-type domain-containing protein n=1 Tax=Zygosaccharomyces rouxii TaxID=4956 RepID=A0A1Q3AJW7_ZYGRO|nr:hypothetical protein ZYGR_0AZ02090 [Zygosaccharomyces rouxii]
MDFYRDSTWILEYLEAEEKKGKLSGSLQSNVLKSCAKYKVKNNPKHIYAVVASCWKYKMYLEKIMHKSGILKTIPQKKGKPAFSRLTIMLLCHDLLISKQKRIQMGKHPIKDYVLKHKARLHAELVKLKLKLKVKELSELVDQDDEDDATPVRWIRINPLKCDISATVEQLNKKFTHRVDHWNQLSPGSIYYDEYVPNLFGIHPSEKITSHDLYKQGKIIIQDRASCFPAHILNPGKDDVVMDACAAPGNKTTHIAAHIMGDSENLKGGQAQIHAFEKEPARAKVLQQMTSQAGCGSLVKIHVGDFTRLAVPDHFEDVTAALVDPSCSGSGIFGRKSLNSSNSSDDQRFQDRLSKLSSFQFQVVKHAMSMPNARKIVYSTCSVHAEENERVVIDLLLDSKVKEWGWQLSPRSEVVPAWPRRGIIDEFEEVFRNDKLKCRLLAESCIRALPREDGGIGFFAVCFQR